MNLTRQPFGSLPDGAQADLFTLTNDNGVEVSLTNYGGILVTVVTPDRSGKLENINLGFDNLASYLGSHPFFGALVGRFANRIAGGKFTLNGVEYTLPINNGPNSLHGGLRGFDKRLWHAEAAQEADRATVVLTYRSADGEEGYPGTLDARVTYSLRQDDAFQIDYAATALDKDTHVNLTNHAYFNLNPAAATVYEHLVQMNAARYAPANADLIPLGRFDPVDGTPFDFRTPTAIGAHIHETHAMLAAGRGYDVGFLVDGEVGTLRLAARVTEPHTGRSLEAWTTEPDCHLYTGGFMDGSTHSPSGKVYQKHGAFCLETQRFPDAPNQPSLPSTLLRAGDTYRSTTVFKFGTL
jgi:aldose 1-epimerase